MGNLECCNSVVVSENIYTPPTEDFQLVPSHSPGNSSLTFILSFKHFGKWIPIPLRIITNNLPWNRNGFFWKWMFQYSLLTESFLNTMCKFQFQFEFQSKDHLNQSIAARKFYCLIVTLVFFWQCFVQMKISDHDNETVLRNNSLLSLKVQYRFAIVLREMTHMS